LLITDEIKFLKAKINFFHVSLLRSLLDFKDIGYKDSVPTELNEKS